GRLEPRGPGHREIHDDDIRGGVRDRGNRGGAVCRLTDDLDVGSALECEAHPFPEHRMVIDEHDADRAHRRGSCDGTGSQAEIVVPPPSVSAIDSVPPSSCALSRIATVPTPAGPLWPAPWSRTCSHRPSLSRL